MAPLKAMIFAIMLTLLAFSQADLIGNFPQNATDEALKWQPAMDFDGDVCYTTSAMDQTGLHNPGLPIEPIYSDSPCRQIDRLQQSQVYVRQNCGYPDDSWCAYLYGYYAEEDWQVGGGHVHEWEHVIVWTQNGDGMLVSWSAHGEYSTTTFDDPLVEFEDFAHPKIVYHHGGHHTASMRLAKDNESPENAMGEWFFGPLLSMEDMDATLWTDLSEYDWGSAHMDIKEASFLPSLKKGWEAWKDHY